MFSSFNNLKIRTKLFIIVFSCLAIFAVFNLVIYATVSFLRVNGPLYNQIIQGKDVIADVLPPPKYIIEAYLIAHHLIDEDEPDDVAKEIRDSYRLEREYYHQQEFWLKTLPEGELKNELTVLSHNPAREFFEIRNKEFMPLFQSGERTKAKEILRDKLEPLYEEHRKHIDRVVDIARKANRNDELFAREIVYRRGTFLLILGILLLVISIFLTIYFVRRITVPLLNLTRATKKISEGDLETVVTAEIGRDEFSLLGLAVEDMRLALKRNLGGLKEEITERQVIEQELLIARNELERRVKGRTAELEKTNKVLVDEIKEHKRLQMRLDLQYAVTRILSGPWSFSDAGAKILQYICEKLGWDLAEIWQVNKAADKLQRVSAWHSPVSGLEKLDQSACEYEFASGEGLPGRVWASGEISWVSDSGLDLNFPPAGIAAQENLQSGFCFPIKIENNIVGVMCFFSREVRQPDYELTPVFLNLGSQTGQFIKRRQAEEEVRSFNQVLERCVFERTKDLEITHNELKKAHHELKSTQSQLIQSAKMASVGQLAGGVAHEINNPLTGVLNNVQLIKMIAGQKNEFKIEDFRSLLDMVENSALRCVKITRSLLDFSHASKDALQKLNLNEVVDKVMTLIGYEMKLQNIIIERQLEPDLPSIIGDPQLLQQALFDLITNARWAIHKKSKDTDGLIIIKTGYSKEKNKIHLSLSDNGIGIPRDNLHRIFEPFFTTKNVGEGTGLGLAIIYNIVKKHNGVIDVESQPGEGATFTLAFPVPGN